MRYHVSHTLKGSLDEVIAIISDRTRDPHVYPNISEIQQARWQECEDRILCEYIVRGDGEIPRPLRAICTPNMLAWREIGMWDRSNNTYYYKLKSFFLTNLVHAHGSIRYSQVDDECVMREVNAEMWIDIPLLGNLAARTVANYQMNNYEREARVFDVYLNDYRRRRVRAAQKAVEEISSNWRRT